MSTIFHLQIKPSCLRSWPAALLQLQRQAISGSRSHSCEFHTCYPTFWPSLHLVARANLQCHQDAHRLPSPLWPWTCQQSWVVEDRNSVTWNWAYWVGPHALLSIWLAVVCLNLAPLASLHQKSIVVLYCTVQIRLYFTSLHQGSVGRCRAQPYHCVALRLAPDCTNEGCYAAGSAWLADCSDLDFIWRTVLLRSCAGLLQEWKCKFSDHPIRPLRMQSCNVYGLLRFKDLQSSYTLSSVSWILCMCTACSEQSLLLRDVARRVFSSTRTTAICSEILHLSSHMASFAWHEQCK